MLLLLRLEPTQN